MFNPPSLSLSESSQQLVSLISELEDSEGDGAKALNPKLKENVMLFKVTTGALMKVSRGKSTAVRVRGCLYCRVVFQEKTEIILILFFFATPFNVICN